MADGRGEPLLSVERSIEVLELFTSRRTTLSLAEMQELLPWPRTTLHRYAHSLRHTGMLAYDTRAARYRLGPKLVRLGTAALNGLPLAELCGPYLEELVRLPT
jgi:DNA-binding IclR family transcriptional regulator